MSDNWKGANWRELQTVCPLVMAMILEQCVGRSGFQVVYCDGFWAFGPVPATEQGSLSAMRANGELTKCGNWFIYPSEYVPSKLTAATPAAVPPSEGITWFRDGSHVVDIERCSLTRSRKGEPFFVIVALVVDSSTHTVGETCSIVINLSRDKSFVMAASEVGANEVTSPMCSLISAFNPLAGVRLNLQCMPVKTRTGMNFTKHVWSSASEAALSRPRPRPPTGAQCSREGCSAPAQSDDVFCRAHFEQRMETKYGAAAPTPPSLPTPRKPPVAPSPAATETLSAIAGRFASIEYDE